jgi:hypothetical protein
MVASNRGKQDARVTLSVADLASARVAGDPNGIVLKPGDELQREFDLTASAASIAPGVNHLRILVHVAPGAKDQSLAETFIAPMDTEPSTPPALKAIKNK